MITIYSGPLWIGIQKRIAKENLEIHNQSVVAAIQDQRKILKE